MKTEQNFSFAKFKIHLVTYWKSFLGRYKEDLAFRKSAWLFAGAFFLSIIGAMNFPSVAGEKIKENIKISLDAAIPEGSVLIPIKVQNETSLDGVFDENGFVDLYSAPEDEHKKSELIFSGAKMIRSPQQHDQFSVIVDAQHAGQIVHSRGVFFVAIQSRNHHRTSVPKKISGRLLTIGSK